MTHRKKLTLHLNPELRPHFDSSLDGFNQIMALSGQIYRHVKNRTTLRTSINGKSYFVKQHEGMGAKELLKNLSQGRLPTLGARQEWQAAPKAPWVGDLTAALNRFLNTPLKRKHVLRTARQSQRFVKLEG